MAGDEEKCELRRTPKGTRLRVGGMLPGRSGLRLRHLGLRPGTLITVLGRTSGGGFLIGVGSGRIVLDRRAATGLTLFPVSA